MAEALYRLGNLNDREGKQKMALASFEAASKLGQQLVDQDPQNDKRRMELMIDLAHVGQIEKATTIAGQLGAEPNLDNELRVQIARCYAQCARSAPDSQAALKQGFLLKAMESLHEAVANGFRDRVNLQTEPDLDPLHSRSDFQALVAGIQHK
jgi:tetratricopeptide (TPR) repeat protein